MNMIKKEEKMLCDIVNNLLEGKECMENIAFSPTIDWDYFYFISEKNRVQFWVLNQMKEYLPISIKKHLEAEHKKFIKKMDAYMEELKYLISLSDEINIPILCIKGLPLAYQLYGNIYTRPFNDIDIVVPQRYILEFRNKLLTDYAQMNKGVYSKDEYLDFVGIFHEFWLKKDINKEQSVFIEIKETSSAIDRRFINEFVKNSISIQINGVKVRTTDVVHTFLHLCSNAYENYETMNGILRHIRMRDLLDIKLFLNNNNLDWEKIVKLSHKYEITHRIYCVLCYVNELFTEKIPEKIIKMFSIDSIKYNLTYCNLTGGKIEWENSVIERMFMDREQKKKIYLEKVYDREISKMDNRKYIMCNQNEKDIDIKRNLVRLEVPGMASRFIEWRVIEVNHNLALDLLLSKTLISKEQFFYQIIFFILGEIKTIWIRNIGGKYKYGYRNDTDDREIEYSKDSETYIIENKLVVRSYLDEERGRFYQNRYKGIGCNVLVHIQQGHCSLPIIAKYSDKSNPEEYLDNIEIWCKKN